MILYIDTSDLYKLYFGLFDPVTCRFKQQNISVRKKNASSTLRLLAKFLRGHGVLPDKNKIGSGGCGIDKIFVVKEPGSFTGIRVGISMALALSLAWRASLRALKKERFQKEISRTKSIAACVK